MTTKLLTISFFIIFCAGIYSCCNSQDSYAEADTEPSEAQQAEQTGLPVDVSTLAAGAPFYTPITISYSDLHNIKATGDGNGLTLDLSNSELWGKVHTGPFPFEAGDSDFVYINYAASADIAGGIAGLPISKFYDALYDSMWWDGNNDVRPKTRNSDTGELEESALGMIDVRDRFLLAVTESTKVAAILTSYEHGYHRTLISKYTLIGVLSDDKKTIDKTAINPRLTNATWHIMCGGTGSGFNA
jgi:hypothetical protein